MASRFEVGDYDYDKLQNNELDTEAFEGDLIYLINGDVTKQKSKKSSSRNKKTADKKYEKLELPNNNVIIKNLPNSVTVKAKISDILCDLDDLGLSSDDDIKTAVSKEKRQLERKKKSKFRSLTPSEAREIEVPDIESRSTRKSKRGKESENLEFMLNEDDDDENKLRLSRKEKQLYRILKNEHNIICNSKAEVLTTSKAMGIDIKTKKKNNTAPLSEEVKDTKKTSLSLLTNNPEYYEQHTTRTYEVRDLKILPFTDEVIKTVIIKASPKLKKLMEILIVNSEFFQDSNSKEVTIFMKNAIKISLELPTYLTARFNSTSILPELQDHNSKLFKILNKFGDEIIKEDEYLNVDLLGLLGHILIWWNFHSSTRKKKFFQIYHWKEFNNTQIRKKIGALHLWDLKNYQVDEIYDSQWEILEKMRINYRFEEDQFYVVLRLMNIDMSI